MDFSIRAVGEVSTVSGAPFSPGDRVWSYLYRTSDGSIERADVLEEERAYLQLDGGILCKWAHRIREPQASEAEIRREELKNTEEIFLSLYEEPEESGETDPELAAERDRMKFFLAIQLERKRILRPLGGGRYRHMPSKQVFTVPELELTPELVAQYLGSDAADSQ